MELRQRNYCEFRTTGATDPNPVSKYKTKNRMQQSKKKKCLLTIT